ncbi:MAG: iron-containing alcohol dehydrogenase, partial [Cyanobacteriota bacterium]
MSAAASSHVIAPAQVLRGEGSWREALPLVSRLGSRPLLLGRSAATAPLRERLGADLSSSGLTPVPAALEHDCCEEDLASVTGIARQASCDAVIAVGGGKVLDAGKLLADRLDLPCVTVPTSAATCAGWTALANLYSPEGAFQRDVALRRCPDLLVFDHGLVRQAPPRTLA